MALSISIVIPALNEAACIQRAVDSAWKAGADEVIVVDGGSQDDTRALAEASRAFVIMSEPGRAKQQNFGASKAKGEVLLFLHADNWFAIEALQQMRDCLKDPLVLGGAFRQSIDAAGFMFRLLEWGNALRVNWRGLAYGDQAIFMRKELFEQLDCFPEVEIMEDLLLMREFRKQSRPILLPGPVYVDARRWQRRGVIRQTLRNWSLLLGQAIGISPKQLARFYPPHAES